MLKVNDMARQSRFVLPGYPQHVIQRGNNRSAIFASAADYEFYLEKLLEGCNKHGCDVHAYVLMTNHVHLLLTPHTEGSIAKLMQFIGRYYVQYFNERYRRTGTLWEGRYKSTLLDTEQYLMTCYRYIEANPERAGMVESPADYPWSSYRANTLGESSRLVVPHSLYRCLGATPKERQAAYRALFPEGIDDRTLDAIRDATNKAWVLGDDRFREHIDASPAPSLPKTERRRQTFRGVSSNQGFQSSLTPLI
jgi:putative transposase